MVTAGPHSPSGSWTAPMMSKVLTLASTQLLCLKESYISTVGRNLGDHLNLTVSLLTL